MNRRFDELIHYLNALSDALKSGHKCSGEIAEIIKELRIELGLEKGEKLNEN